MNHYEQLFDFLPQILKSALGGWLGTLVSMVIILLVTWAVSRMVNHALMHYLQKDQNPFPASSIFLNVSRAVVWLIGISIVLDSCFGINVSAIIAALGVGGIAISLGLRDTIANFFGGLQLSLMRIIEPGDNIRVGTDTGTVQDVTWRHTAIITPDGTQVIIPNSVLSKQALIQVPPANEFYVSFQLAGNFDKALSIRKEIEEAANNAAREVATLTVPAQVSFSDPIDGSLNGSLKLTIENTENVRKAKDAVVCAVAALLDTYKE